MRMGERSQLTIVLTVLLCVAKLACEGCGSSKDLPVQPEAGLSPATEELDAGTDVASDLPETPDTPNDADTAFDSLSPENPTETTTLSNVDESLIDPPALPSRSYRIFLPTSQGPLLGDLRIQVGDRELTEIYNDIIDLVFTDAINGNAQSPTWNEIIDLLEADPSRFGELNTKSEMQKREFIKTWDRNRDGKPDREELARILFRSVIGYKSFCVQGTDYYYGSRAGSGTFKTLDTNGNRRLDLDEVEAASTALRTLDRNADGRIDFSETQPPSDPRFASMNPSLDEAWQQNRSRRDASVAMDFESFVDWEAVAYTLNGISKNTPWSNNGEGKGRFIKAEVDSDANGRISPKEAPGITEINPDFSVNIQLASSSRAKSCVGPVEFTGSHPIDVLQALLCSSC